MPHTLKKQEERALLCPLDGQEKIFTQNQLRAVQIDGGCLLRIGKRTTLAELEICRRYMNGKVTSGPICSDILKQALVIGDGVMFWLISLLFKNVQ